MSREKTVICILCGLLALVSVLALFIYADRGVFVVTASLYLDSVPQSAKININTADSQLLMTLPGIGETIAARIIEYRENAGGFYEISEIMEVDGISYATYNNIKFLITI